MTSKVGLSFLVEGSWKVEMKKNCEIFSSSNTLLYDAFMSLFLTWCYSNDFIDLWIKTARFNFRQLIFLRKHALFRLFAVCAFSLNHLHTHYEGCTLKIELLKIINANCKLTDVSRWSSTFYFRFYGYYRCPYYLLTAIWCPTASIHSPTSTIIRCPVTTKLYSHE